MTKTNVMNFGAKAPIVPFVSVTITRFMNGPKPKFPPKEKPFNF